MLVTINTDASFHPSYKVGAFAFWIVCNQGRILKSGKLKQTHAPHDAEGKCIANALFTLLNSDFNGITRIIINTDSMTCIQRMVGKGKVNTPERSVYNYLKALKKKHGIKHSNIEFRHVKAHQGTDTPRKYVNDWCDKQAKRHMRELVKGQLK